MLPGVCPFCVELKEKRDDSDFHLRTGGVIPSRVLFEDRFFLIVPDIAPIVEGHILLITREHMPSMGFLDSAGIDRLEVLMATVSSIIEDAFKCRPIFFEHGSVDDFQRAGCCVDHAHIHAVPLGIDLCPALGKLFSEARINRMAELRGAIERWQPYILFQRSSGDRFLYAPVQAVSQIVRRLVCGEVGLNTRSNWVESVNPKIILDTMHKLTGAMREIDSNDWR
jgi:ATP adenylyltransferase